jgi:hypothetical protein
MFLSKDTVMNAVRMYTASENFEGLTSDMMIEMLHDAEDIQALGRVLVFEFDYRIPDVALYLIAVWSWTKAKDEQVKSIYSKVTSDLVKEFVETFAVKEPL